MTGARPAGIPAGALTSVVQTFSGRSAHRAGTTLGRTHCGRAIYGASFDVLLETVEWCHRCFGKAERDAVAAETRHYIGMTEYGGHVATTIGPGPPESFRVPAYEPLRSDGFTFYQVSERVAADWVTTTDDELEDVDLEAGS